MSIQTVVRAGNWWSSKIPPLLAIAYASILLFDPAPLNAICMTAAVFWSLCGVASYGHVINDMFDIEQDKQAGKRNFMAPFTLAQQTAMAVGCLAFSFLPALFLDYGWVAIGLLAFNCFLPSIYSIPPLRFKERGLLGVLCDTGGSHLTPTLFIAQAFKHNAASASLQADWFIATAAAWAFVFGLKGILNHMLSDREADIAAGAVTFAVESDPRRTLRFVTQVLYWMELIAFIALTITLFPIAPSVLFLLLAYMAVELTKGAMGWKFSFESSGRYQRVHVPLANNGFYELWFPAALAVQVGLKSNLLAALPIAHLWLFRGNVREQLSDLRIFFWSVRQGFANVLSKRRWGVRLETSPGNRARLKRSTAGKEVVRTLIRRTDGTPWFIKASAPFGGVRKGNFYRLTFRARSDRPRTIGFGVSQRAEPWGGLGLNDEVQLTSDWQTILAEFEATRDEPSAIVYFWLGADSTPVEFADVKVHERSARERWRFDRFLGCQGTLLIDWLDGRERVRTAISRADGAETHLHLSYGRRPVVADEPLSLRFRAKADRPRWIIVGLSQAHEPWNDLGFREHVHLTTQWRDYEFHFRCLADEPEACASFYVGEDDVPVEFMEVEWTDGDPSRSWRMEAFGSSRVERFPATVGASGLRALVTHDGDHAPVKVTHGRWRIRQGLGYEVRFRARADQPIPLVLSVSQTVEPWRGLGLSERFEIGPTWKTYVASFIADSDEERALVEFGLGDAEHPVEIDAVQVLDRPVEAVWRLDRDPSCKAQTTTLDAEVRVELLDVDGDEAHVKLSQGPRPVRRGGVYRLRFRARADAPRFALVGVGQLQEPYSNLGVREHISLAPDWRAFEVDFYALADEPRACIYFMLGEKPGYVEIDQASLSTGDAERTWNLASPEGCRAVRTASQDGRTARVVLSQVDGSAQGVKLRFGGVSVSKGGGYLARFRARADSRRQIEWGVSQPAPPWAGLGLVARAELSEGWRTFIAGFVASADEPFAGAEFGLGESTIAAEFADALIVAKPLETLWRLELQEGFDAQLLESAEGGGGIRVENFGAAGDAMGVRAAYGFRAATPGPLRIRFRGRSDQSSWIRVGLWRSHAPWSDLGLDEWTLLTPEWREYSFEFLVLRTESSASLFFGVGESPAGVELSDLQFEPGLEEHCWRLNQGAGCRAYRRMGDDPDEIQIVVDRVEGEPSNLKLRGPAFPVSRGRSYRLRFLARSHEPSSIAVDVTQIFSPWRGLGLTTTVPLTAQWRNYLLDFEAVDDEASASASFGLAAAAATVEFRELELIPIERWERWSLDQSPSALASLNACELGPQAVRIHLETAGGSTADVKASVARSALVADQPYRVSFLARAERRRWINVGVVQDQAPWKPMGLADEILLTSNWESFSFDFIAEMNDESASVNFFVGGDDADVELQDVRLDQGDELDPWRLTRQSNAHAVRSSANDAGAARVEVVDTDGGEWSVKLTKCRAAIVEQRTYTLAFHARSDASARVAVRVSQAREPWRGLGLNEIIQVGPQSRAYALDFTATDSDLTAAAELGIGETTTAYEVGAINILASDPERAWRLNRGGECFAQLLSGDSGANSRVLEILRADGVASHLKLVMGRFQIKKGTVYRLRFRARADDARWITFGVIQSDSPWRNLGLSEHAELDKEWRDCSAEFLAFQDDAEATVYFWAGESATTVELSDVVLEPGCLEQSWRKIFYDGSRCNATPLTGMECGVRVASIPAESSPWSVKLAIGWLSVEAGEIYRLRFRARGDAPRILRFSVAQSCEPWTSVGFSEEIELTDQWREFLSDFCASRSDELASIQFAVGGSDVPVEIAEPTLSPCPREESWRLDRDDGAQAQLIALADDAVRVQLLRTNGLPAQIKLSHGRRRLSAGAGYRLRFKIRSDERRWIGFGVSQSERPWAGLGLLDELEVEPQWKNATADFIASADETDATVFFLLGESTSAVEIADVRLDAGADSNGWRLDRHQRCRARLLDLPEGGGARIEVLQTDESAWHLRARRGWHEASAGVAYRVVFSARADRARRLRVAVCQLFEPWENLGLSLDLDLSTDWRTFTAYFQAPKDEPFACLQFGVGESSTAVEIAQVAFSPAPSGVTWTLDQGSGARAQLLASSAGNQGVVVEALQTNGNPHQLKLSHGPRPVTAGTRYLLSFSARSNQPRWIGVIVGRTRPPWTNLGLTDEFKLSENWESFASEFIASADEENAAVQFLLGEAGGETAFSDVRVELAAVEPRWRLERSASARAHCRESDAAVRVEIVHAGSDPWHIRASRGWTAVNKGEAYSVWFRARAEEPRRLRLALIAGREPRENLGLNEELELGPEWLDQLVDFVAKEDDPAASLVFALGDSAAATEIAAFRVVRRPLEEAWRVERASGVFARVSVGSQGEISRRIELRGADGIADHVKVSTGRRRVETGKVYRALFQVRADAPRWISVGVGMPEPPYASMGLSQDVELTDEWRSVSADFVATADGDAVVYLLCGEDSTAVEASSLRIEPALLSEHWRLERLAGSRGKLSALPDVGDGVRVQVVRAGATSSHLRLARAWFAVAAGQAYRARFRARADQERKVRVEIGQAHPPWANLGVSEELSLETRWKTYVLDFISSMDDPYAWLQIGLGDSESAVEAADVIVAPISVEEIWKLDRAAGCLAEMLAGGGGENAIRVNIPRVDGSAGGVKLSMGRRLLHIDGSYRVRFRCRADRTRTAAFHICQSSAPWNSLGPTEEISMTREWQTITSDFLSPEEEPYATLSFLLGEEAVGVEFCDVRFEPGPDARPWRLERQPGARAMLTPLTDVPGGARVVVQRTDGEAGRIKAAQAWQLVQKDSRYLLAFRARADFPRRITASLAQAHKPWGNLGLSDEFELTTEWRSFTAGFTALADDPRASVFFGLGGAASAVELTDVALSLCDREAPWRLVHSSTARAYLLAIGDRSDEQRVVIQETEASPWSVKLVRGGEQLQRGSHYRLCFEAKSDLPRKIIVGVSQDHEPWASVGLSQEAELTTQWRKFFADFTAESDELDGGVSFALGGQSVGVSIAGVSLKQREPDDVWRLEKQGRARAQLLRTGEGAVEVAIIDPESDPWRLRLWRGQFPIDANVPMRLRVRARAKFPRSVLVGCSLTRPPWEAAAPAEQIELTTEWQTFVLDFTPKLSDEAAGLFFAVGGSPASVEIADVSLQQSDGDRCWKLHRHAECIAQLTESLEIQEGVRLAVLRTDGNPWHLKLTTCERSLTAGRGYRLCVKARGDYPRRITIGASQASAPWSAAGASEDLELTTEWQTFVVEFIAPRDEARAQLFIAAGETTVALEAADPLFEECDPKEIWRFERHPSCRAQRLDVGPSGAIRAAILLPSPTPWHLKLSRRHSDFQAGRWYRVQFRVRADQPRSMTYGLAQDHEPWDSLGLAEEIELTTAWQTIQTDFRCRRDEGAASLFFWLGGASSSVEIADATLEPTPAPGPWVLERQAGCKAQLLAIPGTADGVRTAILQTEGPAWRIKLIRLGYSTTGGEAYRFRFRARSDAPRPFVCGVGQAKAPYQSLGLYESNRTVEDWREFTAEFTATADESEACIFFWLAESAGAIELCDVVLSMVREEAPEAPHRRASTPS